MTDMGRMDKNKIQEVHKGLDGKIEKEGMELKELSHTNTDVVDSYEDVLGFEDLDPELKEEIMAKQAADRKNLERIAQQHADVIKDAVKEGKEAAKEVEDTASAAERTTERLGGIARQAERAGLNAVSEGRDKAQENAVYMKNEMERIIDKNETLDDIKREFENL
jgi:hypothetical protein